MQKNLNIDNLMSLLFILFKYSVLIFFNKKNFFSLIFFLIWSNRGFTYPRSLTGKPVKFPGIVNIIIQMQVN